MGSGSSVQVGRSRGCGFSGDEGAGALAGPDIGRRVCTMPQAESARQAMTARARARFRPLPAGVCDASSMGLKL